MAERDVVVTSTDRPRFITVLGVITHTVLRIGAGLLFMQHGAQKLFGWLGGVGPEGGTVVLVSLMGLAGVLEFFGGALIVLGLFTRPVAALLVIEMLAAVFMVHVPQGGFPIQNGGELPLLFALVWLFLVGNGAGPASVDRLIFRPRATFRERRTIAHDVPRAEYGA